MSYHPDHLLCIGGPMNGMFTDDRGMGLAAHVVPMEDLAKWHVRHPPHAAIVEPAIFQECYRRERIAYAYGSLRIDGDCYVFKDLRDNQARSIALMTMVAGIAAKLSEPMQPGIDRRRLDELRRSMGPTAFEKMYGANPR